MYNKHHYDIEPNIKRKSIVNGYIALLGGEEFGFMPFIIFDLLLKSAYFNFVLLIIIEKCKRQF